jgi:hypothetical protein
MGMADTDETASVIVAFRADRRLAAAADEAAAREGLSRSDIARRALLRDLQAAREARTAILTMGPAA